jgi:hypothetical protein
MRGIVQMSGYYGNIDSANVSVPRITNLIKGE